jgi:hypothetical protein
MAQRGDELNGQSTSEDELDFAEFVSDKAGSDAQQDVNVYSCHGSVTIMYDGLGELRWKQSYHFFDGRQVCATSCATMNAHGYYAQLLLTTPPCDRFPCSFHPIRECSSPGGTAMWSGSSTR